MVLHVLCVLLSLSVTVVSSTCCLPNQWEAMEIYLIGSYYNGSTITTRVRKCFFERKKGGGVFCTGIDNISAGSQNIKPYVYGFSPGTTVSYNNKTDRHDIA